MAGLSEDSFGELSLVGFATRLVALWPPTICCRADDTVPKPNARGRGAADGTPDTEVVARMLVSDGLTPSQRLMPRTGGNAATMSRFCRSSANIVHSGCGVGGSCGTTLIVSPGSQS